MMDLYSHSASTQSAIPLACSSIVSRRGTATSSAFTMNCSSVQARSTTWAPFLISPSTTAAVLALVSSRKIPALSSSNMALLIAIISSCSGINTSTPAFSLRRPLMKSSSMTVLVASKPIFERPLFLISSAAASAMCSKGRPASASTRPATLCPMLQPMARPCAPADLRPLEAAMSLSAAASQSPAVKRAEVSAWLNECITI
ncbi:hypothetical protein FJTKL_11950 [Diaporthe vaccinii]|uniref:Uncharacterized protein n=1 Tax=Diaporthe vaccinii TaxID=105482 RepID=A0ABR4FAM7_9PEZI